MSDQLTHTRPTLSSILLDLYAAVYCDERWPYFLDQVRHALGGVQAALFLQGLHGGHSRMLSLGAPDYDRLYGEHYGAVNPWFTEPEGFAKVSSGGVVTSEWFAEERLRRTEFHADWLRPQSMFYAINTFVEVGRGRVSNLAVAKSWRQGGFSSDDCRLFEELGQHLRHVLLIQRRLPPIDPRASHVPVLDALPFGFVFLDAQRTVRHANPVAERLFREGVLTVTASGELRTQSAAAAASLRQAVDAALKLARGEDTRVPGLLSLPRLGGRPVAVYVFPTPGRELAFEAPGCTLLLCDSNLDMNPLPRELQQVFGLSDRQAAVAALIVAEPCLTLDDVGSKLGLGRESVKTHLSALYAKTATGCREELLQVLLLGVPLYRSPRA